MVSQDFSLRIYASAKSLAYGLACVFLLACGPRSGLSVKNIDEVPENETLVFGQIKALNMGKEPNFTVFIRPAGTAKDLPANINGNGDFYWHLAPGKYTITHYRKHGWGRIWTSFEAKEEQKVSYIGTLELTGGVVSKTNVVDSYDIAKERLQSKFNVPDENISVSLMITENE